MTRAVLMFGLLALGQVFVACTMPVPPARAAYLDFCAGCHGRDAAGTGAMPALVEAGAADLTGLSRDNGGVFPMADVIAVVAEGRGDHAGVLAMPDFENVLGGRPISYTAPDGAVIETTDTILVLAEYLASVQE